MLALRHASAAEPLPRSARLRGEAGATNVRADNRAKRHPRAAPLDSPSLVSQNTMVRGSRRAGNLSTVVPYPLGNPVSKPEKGRRGKTSRDNCNEPACSGFSQVGLGNWLPFEPGSHRFADPLIPCSPLALSVLSVTATERLPWLLDYALWFAAVHYLVPARDCADCQCRLRRYAHSTPVLCDCTDDFAKGEHVAGGGSNAFIHSAATRSMMRLAASAQARKSPVRGVMFAHMDMWINVRSVYYRGDVPLDSVWVPYGGLPPPVLSSVVTVRKGDRTLERTTYARDETVSFPYCALAGASWRASVPEHILRLSPGCSTDKRRDAPALPVLSRSSEYVHASRSADIPLRYCCYGWSDIFYVPQFALEAFARLTSALHSEPVEVAIPTVAALLEEQANVSWWKMPCIGGCCFQISNPSAYSPYTITALCGHKLGLDKPQYRGLLTRTLHPNATRAKELVWEDTKRFWAEMRSFNPTYNPRLGREGGYGVPMARNATPVRRCGEGSSPAWVETPR